MQDLATYGPAGFLDDIWDLMRNASKLRGKIQHAFAFIGKLDDHNCSTGAIARLTKDAVGSWRGSTTVDNIDPPGWGEIQQRSDRSDWRKGHLLARWFGGSCTNTENLVTLHDSANKAMLAIESEIAYGLKNGKYNAVIYRVIPRYSSVASGNTAMASRVPRDILVEAWEELADGTYQPVVSRRIENRTN